MSERPYGFLTTRSNIIEVKASNPRTAMKRAEKKLEQLRPKLIKFDKDFESEKVTCNYVTYGRYGFAPVGIYKQVKGCKRK